MKNKTLLEIANKHKTDKGQNGYTTFYEKYFEPLRNKKINILEIGVKREIDYPPFSKGACSLKTWKEYFPNANIYGLDIDPMNKKYEEERIQIYIGNQGDTEFLNRIGEEVGHFDIIIDDGAHVNTLTIKAWEGLFPYLAPNGLYIIEDLACSYMNLDAANVRGKAKENKYWWGMHLLPDDFSYNNDRALMNSFLNERIKRLDLAGYRGNKLKAEISSISFYRMMCFMRKR
jgi:hypothetical protein